MICFAVGHMPFETESILRANREQVGSEVDSFTIERYRQFAAHLPKTVKQVLDVGGGIGRGGQELRRLRPAVSITGVDCIPERVAAMNPAVYKESVCAFANNLPLSSNAFDAIVAGEFIEHVPGNMIEPTLNEFFRVLRLGGRLLLTTPNPYYLRNKLQGLSVISEASHVSQHYPEVLRLRLKMAGFSAVRLKGSGKVSRFLGSAWPLSCYGSYLCVASKW
jgi:SAM-dependent methyltransferase